MAKAKTKDLTTTEKVSVGVGLTAAVVAAAGTYFLYGSKKAKQNRKQVKSWMLKAKGEVLERLEDVKEMSMEEYQELVGAVLATYTDVKNASKVELKDLREDLMEQWKKIEKVSKPKKVAKKVAKVANKKSA